MRLETLIWDWKHEAKFSKFTLKDMTRKHVSGLDCCQFQRIVSKLRFLFQFSFHCFQYNFRFQPYFYVLNVLILLPNNIVCFKSTFCFQLMFPNYIWTGKVNSFEQNLEFSRFYLPFSFDFWEKLFVSIQFQRAGNKNYYFWQAMDFTLEI